MVRYVKLEKIYDIYDYVFRIINLFFFNHFCISLLFIFCMVRMGKVQETENVLLLLVLLGSTMMIMCSLSH